MTSLSFLVSRACVVARVHIVLKTTRVRTVQRRADLDSVLADVLGGAVGEEEVLVF